MANKTSANQGSSGEQEGGTPRVSRKVIGKTSAAYERKAGTEGGEEKKPGSEGEQAAGDPGAQAAQAAQPAQIEGQPAPDAGAEAASDQARSESGRPATRKESGSRREARTTSEQAPAAPAGEPVAAAPRAEKAAPAPAAEAGPEPAGAPSAEQPPVPKPDPAAEFEELLKPRDIQRWDPGTPAAPPAKAPPGDSRSFRRHGDGGDEFVLIYRSGSFLIRRAGRVGVMGTWTVTEYPNVGSAAHAYAQQCSDLVHTGFRDLR
jgi:hypothetical protein